VWACMVAAVKVAVSMTYCPLRSLNLKSCLLHCWLVVLCCSRRQHKSCKQLQQLTCRCRHGLSGLELIIS
jgi:hypothetical protein